HCRCAAVHPSACYSSSFYCSCNLATHQAVRRRHLGVARHLRLCTRCHPANCCSFVRVYRWQKPASFTSLGTEEAVKDALNIIEMLFFDVAASFEVITKHGRARTTHHAQLLAQIRQVFCLRRLSLLCLRHLGGAPNASAKDIA